MLLNELQKQHQQMLELQQQSETIRQLQEQNREQGEQMQSLQVLVGGIRSTNPC
jgi:hypothetical protein